MESLDQTTPEFTNYDEDTGRINFAKFREHYKISAAAARAIVKQLGLDIIREGADQYIVGENPYSVSNSYYLKHAIYEYRKTMYVNKTKAGEFLEFEVDVNGNTLHYGVHNTEEEDVKPASPSLRTIPNKQSPNILVPVDRGAELMMRKKSAPPAPLQAPGAGIGGDALQVLVAALTEAQKAAQAPDTLLPQKTLLEAEEKGFLVTTEQLGQLLGMSKGTISSKKSGFRKLGFEFEKVKEGSATLWKVKRY